MEIVGVEGEVVEAFGFLAGFSINEGWIEPTTPSIGFYVGGLAGSVVGQEP